MSWLEEDYTGKTDLRWWRTAFDMAAKDLFKAVDQLTLQDVQVTSTLPPSILLPSSIHPSIHHFGVISSSFFSRFAAKAVLLVPLASFLLPVWATTITLCTTSIFLHVM